VRRFFQKRSGRYPEIVTKVCSGRPMRVAKRAHLGKLRAGEPLNAKSTGATASPEVKSTVA